jgi:hypothetical protein
VDRVSPQLMLFAPDSPASQSVTTGTDAPETMNDGCGRRFAVLWAKWNPATFSWKTSLGYSMPAEDSATSSLTWPASGLMRNGSVYQLSRLVPRTIGKESGLWPTVQTTDAMMSRRHGYTFEGHAGTTLTDAVLIHHDAMPDRQRGERIPSPLAPNPAFCERLMGFPEGWTECTHLETR